MRRIDKSDRISGVAGLIAIAFLLAVSVLLLTGESTREFGAADEPATVRLASDRAVLIWALILEGFALMFYIWFLGGLRSALNKRVGPNSPIPAVVFGAGLAGAILIFVEDGAILAAAYRLAPEGQAAAVDALYEFAQFGVGIFIRFPQALLLGAMAYVVFGRKCFALPVGLVAIVGAAGNVVAAVAVLVGSEAYAAGLEEHLVATLPWGAWLFFTSLSLASDTRSAAQDEDARSLPDM